MSIASRAKGLRSGLFCARCDNEVPAGAVTCPFMGRSAGNTGRAERTCGSRAFYRRGARPVRHIMGAPLPDDPPEQAEPPVHARRTYRGARRGPFA